MEHSDRVTRSALAALLAAVLATGCQVGPAPAGPAVMRTGPAPWDAPRDAVSYIDAAGLEKLPLSFRGPASYLVKLIVAVDGKPVEVPGGIGLDLVRAQQAPVHTHSPDGILHVEARTAGEHPTLKQFFALWGVRYDDKCLGDACGSVTVRVNGVPGGPDSALPPDGFVQVTATH
jgi:hypothetical protein